jgi:succinyl-CoA synthetase beta subunit
MDLLEYQGKQLFKKHGLPVPDGRRNPTQVAEIAVEILGARV